MLSSLNFSLTFPSERACKAVGIEHFVYSSLTSLKEESKGKYTDIHHHEAKAAVEDFAKERLKFFTTIKPAAFYTNLGGPGWVRRQGTASFVFPFHSTGSVFQISPS